MLCRFFPASKTSDISIVSSIEFIFIPCLNKTIKSKISTQLLYGEKFEILKKYSNCYKIKSSFDRYIGYISKKKYPLNAKPTHKVSVLKASLYSKPNKKFIINAIQYLCDDSGLVNLKSKNIKLRMINAEKINNNKNLIILLNIFIPVIIFMFLTLIFKTTYKRKYD